MEKENFESHLLRVSGSKPAAKYIAIYDEIF